MIQHDWVVFFLYLVCFCKYLILFVFHKLSDIEDQNYLVI